MEFLSLVLLLAAIYYLWIKPENEKMAFRFFLLGTLTSFGMYFVSSWASFLPFGSY